MEVNGLLSWGMLLAVTDLRKRGVYSNLDSIIMFERLFSHAGLTLDRLHALLEVHDAGSIAQAAPGNPVRHSQYSRQLRELSEFFGCEVAERHGKRVKLTPNGIRLAELSREYMRALEDFTTACHGARVEFTIAAGDSLIQWLVIPRLGALMQQLSQVRFRTESSRTREMIQKLAELRVDFGIVRKDAVISGLKAVKLGTLSYTALVPTSISPKKKSLILADAFRLPFAFQETGGQFSRQLIEIGRSLVPGFEPSLACQSFPQTMAAVRSGGFAAVLPTLSAMEIGPRSVRIVHDAKLGVLTRELVLVWNPRMFDVRPIASEVAEKLRIALQIS